MVVESPLAESPQNNMKIIPVLDVMEFRVVRGVAGRRDEYKPIQSLLTSSHRPKEVAQSIREHFGLSHFYLADLDAITAVRPPSWSMYQELRQLGLSLAVDCGVRTAADAARVLEHGVDQAVVGLETLDSPAELDQVCAAVDPDRLLISVDLHNGRPLSNASWPQDPRQILEIVGSRPARRILLLDLARVGTGQGIGTEDWVRECKERHPNKVVLVGGGVRGFNDLVQLRQLGVDGVLVASVLHSGVVAPEQISQFHQPFQNPQSSRDGRD